MSEGVGQVGAVGVVVARVNQRVKKPAQGVEMRTVILLWVEQILMCCVSHKVKSFVTVKSLVFYQISSCLKGFWEATEIINSFQ